MSVYAKRASLLPQLSTAVTISLGIWLFAGTVSSAQDAAPFERLAGHWSGAGTIDLSSGARERISCRASYDVLTEQQNLQFNIRCASDSYHFDLRGSAKYAGGSVTGTWSEPTRNAAGTISGNTQGDHFEVQANGPNFSASLTLTTQGDRQSVVIRSHDAKGDVKGATIALQRS